MTLLLRPPPSANVVPLIPEDPVQALRGQVAMIAVNLAAVKEALALIEEVRFARTTPRHVAEALSKPARMLGDAATVIDQWADRALGREKPPA